MSHAAPPDLVLPPTEVQVLLTSYNRRALLAQSVDSVLAQTHEDLHVLIVDDASPDGAGELAKDYERRFPGQVTAICKPTRRGVAHSCNLVLPLMRQCPFVAFIADDDMWHL